MSDDAADIDRRKVPPQVIAAARDELERRWEKEGECSSCGWHAALYEHKVTDDDLREALLNGGLLHLACLSEDDEDPFGHHGVKIKLETLST